MMINNQIKNHTVYVIDAKYGNICVTNAERSIQFTVVLLVIRDQGAHRVSDNPIVSFTFTDPFRRL